MLFKAIRRWNTRRRFSKLSPAEQRLAFILGIDPDSLIERGLL